ncbi:MobB family relaxase [uncultured Christiangramia sp.]|uniref:MobB family relaxase n=1 Tax=Christiangramia sp. 3-2217-3z TaxID=3417564 RepID=UPI002638A168|nr:MobB family relaxase [uncultured Christiangramia sp.]
MYISISPQKLGGSFSQSVGDFVIYLEKENQEKNLQENEYFFNQYDDKIRPYEVIKEIDGNTAKLKQTEPKYYSITVNPSQYELKHIHNNPEKLKTYVRDLMKEYASAFNREINGRPIHINDIKYYAKIEHQRTYKSYDTAIKENAPYSNKIAHLQNKLRKVARGEVSGNMNSIQNEIKKLSRDAPYKIQGQPIEEGMKKEGLQTHIHIVVSRKDASNSYSLSPGSKYKASEVMMHGKNVKRGFERDRFFKSAEKSFDRLFSYNRNYVESYMARKTFTQNPQNYFSILMNLAMNEKKIAFKMLRETGLQLPILHLPQNKVGFAYKQLKKIIETGLKSSSIGY